MLFFIGVATGVLLGKLVFDDETKGPSSANWGGTVTQDGVQKPVLEAIVDMMDANNIEEYLKYHMMQNFDGENFQQFINISP